MGYTMNLGAWNSVFAVPCRVVDENLKLAGSVQLKVLLWVLRHAGEPFEPEDIAKAIGINKADVADAMQYWQQTGLIAADGGTLTPDAQNGTERQEAAPFRPQPAEEPAPAQETASAPEPASARPEKKAQRVLSRPQKPDSDFTAKRIAESTEIACLMQSAQQILGRLISGGECATLLMIHDDFGLPSDVIVMLLQYTASIGKANMRYIEKTAMNWADEGIVTHEKAEEKLRRLSENQQAWRTVEQAIGMTHRAPSANEELYAPVWVGEWGFGPEMIQEAYDRTVDATGKYSAGYMNKIMARWHKDGIATPQQAALEKSKRAAAHGGGLRAGGRRRDLTFDIDEYERTSIYDTKE